MRSIIEDQVSHTFIEGPIQSKPATSTIQDESVDKAASTIDITGLKDEVSADISDRDMPFNEA